MRERIIYVGKWHAVPDRIDIDSGLSKEARAVWHNFAAHASRGGGRFFPDRDRGLTARPGSFRLEYFFILI